VRAHTILNTCVLIGTIITVVLRPCSDCPAIIAGPTSLMPGWTYHVWAGMGFSSAPLILAAYLLAYWGRGKARYLALFMHVVGNVCAFTVLSSFLYAAAVSGIIVRAWAFAWVVFAGAAVFLLWLIGNDIGRLGQLETLATQLRDDAR